MSAQDIGEIARRLASLEEFSAHQQATIEDLSAMVEALWKTVDRQNALIERLKSNMLDIEDRVDGNVPSADVRPPHY
ncbi:SlyX family protein [Varunaivibrio sulfuroxidans]|uniref:Putative coiled-coil protein SlyX n=1 Tax=Varunaivibrio sulfuroxidans TaxID=1773489 RepID=A0A4R3JE57_9PROT|nr:SlyX family protein [Varunaivibrio sulfuroxidans]TCS64338.1 putative coiled-coil protein SlyX [Varunaivibrio sulfuroxidans]WES31224.1 SlyX family protein [Varunaivibrio sulfuroxidans]